MYVGNHHFRELFEVVVDDPYPVFPHRALSDPQHSVLFHELLLIDVGLLREGHQFLVVPLFVQEETVDLDSLSGTIWSASLFFFNDCLVVELARLRA